MTHDEWCKKLQCSRPDCVMCRKAWSAAQQTNNSAMVQLLCDVKGLLLNHDTPPREARADVIRAINAVLAQQHQ